MKLESPIFVVGRPRSGTTLMSAILSTHPHIVIAPETHFINTWMPAFMHLDLSSHEGRLEFCTAFSRSRRFQHLGLDTDQVCQRMELEKSLDFSSFLRVLLILYAEKHGKQRWGEKTPNHEAHIETIIEWYPNAKVIYMVRDPRAVISSSLKMPWVHHQIYRHAITWQRSVDRVAGFSTDRVKIVKYEGLVERADDQVRQVCHFIDEEYYPRMVEEYTKAADPLIVDQPWKNGVQHPIYRSAIDKWRTRLTAKDIATIEYFAGAGMTEHGYASCSDYKLSVIDLISLFIRRIHRKVERSVRRKQFNLI